MNSAYIGIGSNLDHPVKQVKAAILSLASMEQLHVSLVSSLYCSEPWGVTNQPLFINCVVAVETSLSPLGLLNTLFSIEEAQGRIRQERYGPRTLDLDLLLYGNETMHTPELTLPHPRMIERDFVLYPLAEIASSLYLPGETEKDVRELCKTCSTPGIYRLEEMVCPK